MVRKQKNLWIFLILIIMFSSLVLAVPPTTIVNNFDEGLALDFKDIEIGKINTGFGLIVHTYNLSDGYIVKAPLSSCQGHLFRPNGSILLDQNAKAIEGYFSFTADKNNITTEGFYSYSIHCNTSTLGGYSSGGFYVTTSGLEKVPEAIYGLAILLIGLLIYFLYLANSFNENHPLLKILFIWLNFILLIPVIVILRKVADQYSEAWGNILQYVMVGYSPIFIFISFYFVVVFIKNIIELLARKKEKKQNDLTRVQ